MQPSDRPLRVEVSPFRQGVVVTLSGSATMDRCAELNAKLVEAAGNRPSLMVIDLGDLDFICSLGLGSLVAAYLRARRYDGKVVLSCPLRPIREMLELTKLNTLLPVHLTSEEAIAAASS